MAIGRVSGQMLSSSLDRQSNLTFINNTATLMHLDFSGQKVGINTDTVTEALTINGNLSTSNVLITGATISAKNNATLFLTGQVNLGSNATVHMTGGNYLDVISTDGAGNLTWSNVSAMLTAEHFLQNVTINGSTISTNTTNGNLVLQGNGTGEVTSPLMYVTSLSAGTITSSNINGTFNGIVNGSFAGNLTGNVITPAQPYITSLGTLTGLTVSGNVNASLNGDVYTNNIYGIAGNLTITPQPGTILTVNSTAAQVLPVGSTGQRPVAAEGAFRYNTESKSPEFFNGTSWVSMASEVSSQTLYGNNSADTFLLNYPTTANGIIVSINGTLQQPSVAYALSPAGDHIIFTEVPKTGDTIEIRYLSTTTLIEMAQQNAITVVSPTISYGTSPTLIDQFRMSEFRSAKYTVSGVAANGDPIMSEVMVMHNGITSIIGASSIGVANVAVYTSTIAAGNVQVMASSALSGASLKLYKLYFPI